MQLGRQRPSTESAGIGKKRLWLTGLHRTGTVLYRLLNDVIAYMRQAAQAVACSGQIRLQTDLK